MSIIKPKFVLLFILIIGLFFFILYLPDSINKRKKININKTISKELSVLNSYLKNGQINTAINHAVDIYKKYPENSGEIYCFLADIYASAKDLKKAEWFYRNSIKAGAKNVICYIKLAYFYRLNKQYNSSLIILNECYKFAPYNFYLLNEFGELFYDQKDYNKALEYWIILYKYSRNKDIILKILKCYYKSTKKINKQYLEKYLDDGGNIEDVTNFINK